MKKKLLCVLMVLCALLTLAMVLSFAACGSKATPTEQTTQAATVAAPAETEEPLNLTDWSLSASTWSSPNGATIHLTAAPTRHTEGDSAVFTVRLEGEEVTSAPCTWENDTYTASVDLNAADGYCYYVVLTGADGTTAEVAVNTPAQPVEENYINLAAALESYCSLTLEQADLAGDKLTISGGTAVVQAPRITDDGENIACAKATLVLTLDGQEVGSTELTMAPGDASRSYEASLADVSFPLPGTIGEQQQLSLRLDAELTNGQKLTAQGGSWYYQDGAMTNAVG
ncbi:MAG: hypothetical protein ACI3V1_06010 [Faecousia sp.]